MNLDAMKKDKMKQRSFYMDDETYALIERHAERLGTSNGTALRMLVRHELLDVTNYMQELTPHQEPVAVQQRPAEAVGLAHLEGAKVETAAAGIILPPDTQETFRVPEKFREKGPRVPRVKHSDDDF